MGLDKISKHPGQKIRLIGFVYNYSRLSFSLTVSIKKDTRKEDNLDGPITLFFCFSFKGLKQMIIKRRMKLHWIKA